MSSRALRKAQREREEQERLAKLQAEHDDAENEDIGGAAPVKKSAFELLNEAEDEEEDGGVDADEHEAAEEHPKEDDVTQSIPKTSSKKKKRKKKGKAAAAAVATPAKSEDEDLDEIDKALKELRTNGKSSLEGTTAAGVSAQTEQTSKLLAVDSSHLQAQNEMRRLFGRAALEQRDDDEQPENANIGGNRRQQRRVQQVGLAQALRGQQPSSRQGGLTAMALRRNIFIQGKEEWPNATGGGLGMEIEEKRADGTILYRFVHNTVYEEVQRQFLLVVESMDPNRMVLLLQHNPYHIATLLQVSEIAKQDRNHAVSGDLLERALFSFGRVVHSTFAKTLAAGKARMDFRRPQNREFWLASWLYMQNLSMRATWRTTYEWAKLLLQLSPEDDPYAMSLVLDQYALRSRQDLDFLNLSRKPIFKGRMGSLPHVQLSQGLAEYRAGNKSKGQQALFKAVGRYPWLVFRLMQQLNIDPPPAVWGKEPRTRRERLHAELYATQAKDLWGPPETSALLIEIASALPPDTEAAAPLADDECLENEARHIILSETPALIALIPRHFTERVGSASDPLPPQDSYPSNIDTSPRPHSGMSRALRDELARVEEWIDRMMPGFRQQGDLMDYVDRAMAEHNVAREQLLTAVARMHQLRMMLPPGEQGVAMHNEDAEEEGYYDSDDVGPVGGWPDDDFQARVEDAEGDD